MGRESNGENTTSGKEKPSEAGEAVTPIAKAVKTLPTDGGKAPSTVLALVRKKKAVKAQKSARTHQSQEPSPVWDATNKTWSADLLGDVERFHKTESDGFLHASSMNRARYHAALILNRMRSKFSGRAKNESDEHSWPQFCTIELKRPAKTVSHDLRSIKLALDHFAKQAKCTVKDAEAALLKFIDDEENPLPPLHWLGRLAAIKEEEKRQKLMLRVLDGKIATNDQFKNELPSNHATPGSDRRNALRTYAPKSIGDGAPGLAAAVFRKQMTDDTQGFVAGNTKRDQIVEAIEKALAEMKVSEHSSIAWALAIPTGTKS